MVFKDLYKHLLLLYKARLEGMSKSCPIVHRNTHLVALFPLQSPSTASKPLPSLPTTHSCSAVQAVLTNFPSAVSLTPTPAGHFPTINAVPAPPTYTSDDYRQWVGSGGHGERACRPQMAAVFVNSSRQRQRYNSVYSEPRVSVSG
jgi:hypothetical protein